MLEDARPEPSWTRSTKETSASHKPNLGMSLVSWLHQGVQGVKGVGDLGGWQPDAVASIKPVMGSCGLNLEVVLGSRQPKVRAPGLF